MVHVPGGVFAMGSDDFYPEEQPVHQVEVDGFMMDEHPVTVAEFRRFVKATRYVTVAERPLDPTAYPGADPDLLVPGSLVFDPPDHPVDLRVPSNWWSYRPGAQWRHPEGPTSTLHGRERHPVTHVAPEDAEAFAAWTGKELPTEAEWEFAARGGLEGATFVWGDEFAPKGKMMANTWQGEFPWQNLTVDGFEGTSPVRSFPPNGYGLYDVAGNVWEWTSDYFTDFDRRRSPRLLRASEPASDLTGRQPRRRSARRAHPEEGHQGRFAPLRPQLLPPLSAVRAAERGDRHFDGPHRVPVRDPLTPGAVRR